MHVCIDDCKKLDFIIQINNILSENSSASFLIDITTFTRQTLLILLRLLRNTLTEKNQIQFLYVPAKEYSIGLRNLLHTIINIMTLL